MENFIFKAAAGVVLAVLIEMLQTHDNFNTYSVFLAIIQHPTIIT
jgi:hypothetical protein